jgi:hypothetical protein
LASQPRTLPNRLAVLRHKRQTWSPMWATVIAIALLVAVAGTAVAFASGGDGDSLAAPTASTREAERASR